MMRRILMGLGAFAAVTIAAGVRDASACCIIFWQPPTQFGAALSEDMVAATGLVIVAPLGVKNDEQGVWVVVTPLAVTIDDPLGNTIHLSGPSAAIVLAPGDSKTLTYYLVPTITGVYSNLDVHYSFQKFSDAALTQPLTYVEYDDQENFGFIDAAPPLVALSRDLGLLAAELREHIYFVPFGQRYALFGHIRTVRREIDLGNFGAAERILEHTILARMNGCAATGAPDPNDFVQSCDAQAHLLPFIELVAGLLGLQAAHP